MSSRFGGEAARQINRLFRDGTTIGLTDGQLIERFTTRRGDSAEAAFEALVLRHGPMVLRVLRGVLRDPHEVDDAFQATFLVLVKKAHTLGERDLLAPWLYGVAQRVALKSRTLAARRNRREGGVIDDPPAESTDAPWLDLRPILHEELNRLPDKYKKPVILCHLQGLTHAEAAQELAWPVGTVSVRLTRARKLLKDRLTRRGLTNTASLWPAGLLAEAGGGVVPQALINATAKAAVAASTGKMLVAGTISAGVLTLTRRTLTMMWMSRLKWMIVPVALGVGAAGGVVVNQQIQIRSADAKAKAELAKAEAPKPPGPANSETLPPIPPRGVSPFVADERPMLSTTPDDLPSNVQIPVLPSPKVVPADNFEITSLATKDESGPPIIKPGQVLRIEVLEALPGRPITGDRLVRPDGTISLGFYGDLRVAGLNRNQVKVKLLEHLRQYIQDEVLGLFSVDAEGNPQPIPPIYSNRVLVDESANYFPAGPDQAPRPRVNSWIPDDVATNARISELEKKLDRILKELEALRDGHRPSGPTSSPFDIEPAPTDRKASSQPGPVEDPKNLKSPSPTPSPPPPSDPAPPAKPGDKPPE